MMRPQFRRSHERRRVLTALVLAALALVQVVACTSRSGSGASKAPPPSTLTGPAAIPLRQLAARRHLEIGTAVDDVALTSEADYRTVLADQFSLIQPENAMKWDATESQPGHFDFSGGDRVVAVARQHGQAVMAGPLVWYFQNPPWVDGGNFSRDQAIAALWDHIHGLVGHYRGVVRSWIVVNEALDDGGGSYRDNVWLRSIGPDYIAIAFRFAHEADPAAKLYLNDFDVQMPGPKTERMIQMVLGLKAQGVPISGLGSQFHVFRGITSIDFSKVSLQMRQVADACLDYAVTEWDMGVALPATPSDLARQGRLAEDLLRACVTAPRCPAFIVWGFTDRHSWIPSQTPGYGAATPYDEQLRPKPAWAGLAAALRAPG